MATVCSNCHSTASGGHLHAYDKRCAPSVKKTFWHRWVLRARHKEESIVYDYRGAGLSVWVCSAAESCVGGSWSRVGNGQEKGSDPRKLQ